MEIWYCGSGYKKSKLTQQRDPTGLLPLSSAQTSILESWKRPHEISPDFRLLPHPGEALDLTQDIVTDCSVVASLCVASRREEKGFGPTVTQMLYPQDSTGRPVQSKNGKYVVKLFFNGCYRKVCFPIPSVALHHILSLTSLR
jgi:calpain-7